MAKRILVLSVVGLALGLMAPKALACWDNTDEFVIKLKKVKLSTKQLKEIFAIQKQHKAVVVRAHKEGLGCRYHENHEAVFQKQAVGVLTDAQFKTAVGRKRARGHLETLLALFEVAAVDRAVLTGALELAFGDFEDAVLHQAAAHAGATGIVTRDVAGFRTARLTVYAPDELLTLVEAGPPT